MTWESEPTSSFPYRVLQSFMNVTGSALTSLAAALRGASRPPAGGAQLCHSRCFPVLCSLFTLSMAVASSATSPFLCEWN